MTNKKINQKDDEISSSNEELLDDNTQNSTSETLICGLIRPISTMSADYTDTHWNEVLKVIEHAVVKAGFSPRTVSDSSYAKIIHGSIINNIYDDPIVVCDVSNKNANVMFELGLRLAFDKPVVIIKDDKTDFSFDTSSYKHLIYPYDLQFNKTQDFIDELAKTIKETYDASTTNDYVSFLSHYKKINVSASHIEAKKLGSQDIGVVEALSQVLNELNELRYEFRENKAKSIKNSDNMNIDYNVLIGQTDRYEFTCRLNDDVSLDPYEYISNFTKEDVVDINISKMKSSSGLIKHLIKLKSETPKVLSDWQWLERRFRNEFEFKYKV